MTTLSPQAVANSVHELPPLPAVVLELIHSLEDASLGAEQLADKISHDQAIAAKTLRLANSSFFGLSRHVSSIADASAVLGLRTVRSIATAAGLAGSFSREQCPGFDFEAFWRHSIACALCAEALAEPLRLDPGTAFTAGLLHDIGRLALASGFSRAYAAAMSHRREHDSMMLEAEQAVLGTDHCVVGALIAEHWRFAPDMVEAIARHHCPSETDGPPLVDLVHLADNMAHGLDLSLQVDDIVPPLSMAAWARLGLNEAKCIQVFRQTEARHEAVCQAVMM